VTRIDFYTSVPDKLQTACRIASKVYSLGHKIVIFCPDAEVANRIDRLLWTHPPTGFVPHCITGNALAAVTPVVIDFRGDTPPHDEVLVNLTAQWPPLFSRFQRLVEIVSVEDEDRQLARERFKFYRDRGYEIRTHALGTEANSRA
jgi:DNA polymerase III subunit chi